MPDVSVINSIIELDIVDNILDVAVTATTIDISITNPVIEVELSCYPGVTVPPGGATGMVLAKLSDANGDIGWVSVADLIRDYLNGLEAYTDDAAAVADGLALNDHYWVADGSDSNIPGNFRRVTTV